MLKLRTALVRIGLVFGLAVIVSGGAFVVWGSTPLGPSETAIASLDSDAVVAVTQDAWMTFSPVGDQPTAGLVFYPGGRVDPRSYAPLARSIATEGFLVVVVPMPLNLAFFAPMRADAVMSTYGGVATWAIGGHSLGGAMAARYAYEREGVVDALILWAAYPAATDDLSSRSDLAALSLYGTQDGLMTATDLATSRPLMPEHTCWVPIEGGNHAQFGDYGAQGRDNAAAISLADQHTRIVSTTGAFLNMLDAMEAGSDFDCSGVGLAP